jgi:drug/metabolite transporter (DMT)-like permease
VAWRKFVNLALIYILVAVLASAVGQLVLKKGMSSMGVLTLGTGQLGSILARIITNPYVLLGLVIYACGTLFWLVALSRVDLSYAYPFVSFSYVVMLVASWLLLNEQISLLRIAGSAVVILGVLLISRS